MPHARHPPRGLHGGVPLSSAGIWVVPSLRLGRPFRGFAAIPLWLSELSCPCEGRCAPRTAAAVPLLCVNALGFAGSIFLLAVAQPAIVAEVAVKAEVVGK